MISGARNENQQRRHRYYDHCTRSLYRFYSKFFYAAQPWRLARRPGCGLPFQKSFRLPNVKHPEGKEFLIPLVYRMLMAPRQTLKNDETSVKYYTRHYQVVALSHGTLPKVTAALAARKKTKVTAATKSHSTGSKTQWAHHIHDGQQSSIMRLKPCRSKCNGHTTFRKGKRMRQTHESVRATFIVVLTWFQWNIL